MGGWREILHIARQIDSPGKKRDFNQRHFRTAASRYDLATRAMSLGRDQGWKKRLVAILPDHRQPVCVDLASGTGDLIFLLAARYSRCLAVGIDLTVDMVARAKRRGPPANAHFLCQDMADAGFADGCIDIVTGSYALRNAPHLPTALAEVHRILKPGGYAAFLDFAKSSRPGRQRFQYYLLKGWCGLWGTLLHGKPAIHAYIADSLLQFPDRKAYHDILCGNGFEIIHTEIFYFGLLELVLVRKT